MEGGPCCVGVVRDAAGLTGETVTVGGAPAYLARPVGENKNVGVLVIHDIFGWNIPNSKYIADHFSKHGFTAILPNLYQNISSLDGWPCTEFDDGDALEGDKWDAWWTEITTEGYWRPFHERVAAAVQFLKGQGCTAMCLIGFCWGGCAIEQLSTTGVFTQVASVHGVHEGAANYEAAKVAGCNIEYHTVPGDDSFEAPAQKALRDAGASVTVYDGMEHGFAVRGDFGGSPALKAAADSCLEAIVRQFSSSARL